MEAKKNCYFATGAEMIERILAPLSFDVFLMYMPMILDLARGMSDIEGTETNRRGCLTLMNGITGEIAFTVPFGEIPAEKAEKYFELSQEKAIRLFSHLQDGHTTSYESRNVEAGEYGGAIYLDYHSCVIILSFSGMPELIDEAMMLTLGDKLAHVVHKPVMKNIEACFRNPYWESLREKASRKF